jgi:2-aminoethylphosphonate-pyruvate transaminase
MNDKKLFTPGPLTTSLSVKQAMLRDLGSRDYEFINTIADIRKELLNLAEAPQSNYEAVIMQGSGTFGVESVIGSAIPKHGHLLVIINGAYGKRIRQMAQILNISFDCLEYPENRVPDLRDVDQYLHDHQETTHVAVIHCETTTGILNPVHEIGSIVNRHQRKFIVDAMSSFGVLPVSMEKDRIHFLISSSNKCIEGVPGFSFVIAERESLLACKGQARSLSLDLFAQWDGLQKDGQFRFTPPTHVVLAFRQALNELHQEGGRAGRENRYRENHELLINGMKELNIKAYIADDLQSPIITTFLPPDNPNYDFERFYKILNERGLVIYPGKLTDRETFRIGNIGHLHSEDIQDLLEAVKEAFIEMNILTRA